MNIQLLLSKLTQGDDLTLNESKSVAHMMLQMQLTPSQIGAFLTALRAKGESEEELIGFIHGIKKHMIHVDAKDAIDVCGTGGDGKNTFNISTAVAFVVAGCGVKVAKHGNRAVSSKSGSADVLETLGINIHLSTQQAEDILRKVGMVFLFAPLFHPAFKYVAPIRKELGIPTIFNYLGPFLNPANTTRQLIGVASEDLALQLIRISKKLGYKHLCIVVSEDGMDEVSIHVKTKIFENKDGYISSFVLNPLLYGFYYKRIGISGGVAQKSADIITSIFEGEKGQKRDIVVFNSAVALYSAGKAKNIEEGIELAKKSIDSGNAKSVLENLRKETQKYA